MMTRRRWNAVDGTHSGKLCPQQRGTKPFLCTVIAFLVAAASHLPSVVCVSPDVAATVEITTARIKIYNQVIQAVAMETARTIGQGTITQVPPLPFSNNKTSAQVVLLDVHTLQQAGFTFNEFNIPPGVLVATTEPTIILLYNKYSLQTSPVGPPFGFNVTAPILSLTAFPISALSNPNAAAVTLTAPAGAAITVTYPFVSPGSVCTTFNTSGGAMSVPTRSTATAITCVSPTLGTFTLVKSLTSPPPQAPPPLLPPPASAPLPMVSTPPGGGASPPGSPGGANSPPSAPSPSPGGAGGGSGSGSGGSSSSSSSNTTALAVGLGVGLGLPLLLIAAFGLWYGSRAYQKRALENMEKESDKRASLETAIVGGSRAPAAGALRTRPYLESEDLTSDRI